MAAKQKPILYKGMGQPYLALFNFGGMPIMNPITGIEGDDDLFSWHVCILVCLESEHIGGGRAISVTPSFTVRPIEIDVYKRQALKPPPQPENRKQPQGSSMEKSRPSRRSPTVLPRVR